MKRRIIMHVGFDKVGSSSIQTYLSNNELISNKNKYVYGIINSNGDVLTDNLEEKAKKNPLGYLSSYPNVFESVDSDLLKRKLDKLFEQNIIPIFSCEGWARNAEKFKTSSFFQKLDVEATVVFYIRPQVDWLNSAWWQWFHWHPNFSSTQDYFNKLGRDAADWNRYIDEWAALPNTQSIKVRLQNQDNVEDFLSIFDIQASIDGLKQSRSNTSLAPELIKLLSQYPEYRGLHDSHVDWKLAKIFDFKGKTPWVIDEALCEEIIKNYNESNLILMNKLSPIHRDIMSKDNRWWSTAGYSEKRAINLNEMRLSESEKDKIIQQMLDYLLNNI